MTPWSWLRPTDLAALRQALGSGRVAATCWPLCRLVQMCPDRASQ